jgi:hypothetical protein
MTKTYSLSSMHKLVDLNGDLTNFDLAFTVKSKDGSEFEGVVVDQKMLDSGDPIKYRKSPGSLSGNIVSDKGVYQNFFLVLRSVNECECEVSINIKEIPAKEPDPTPTPVQQEKAPVENLGKALSTIKSPRSGTYNWKLIIIFLIVLGVGGYIFYIYSQKKKDGGVDTNSDISPSSSTVVVPPTSNSYSVGGSQGGSLKFSSPASNSLTDRLHRLQPN